MRVALVVATLTGRFGPMQRIIRSTSGLLLGAALLLASFTLGSTPAFAQFAGPVPLSLVNGWTNAPIFTSNTTVELVKGIVQFRGAIAGGTSAVAFTLPAAFRPLTDVYVPVDLANTPTDTSHGRLHITSSGVVDVEAEGGTFTNAQFFTSLDGASFALTAYNFTSLTLTNGWTNAPFGTSNAAAREIAGIVHFKGAIASGTSAVAFTLPAAFSPLTDVYVPVDLCNATNGRLHITSSGVVEVEAEGGTFSNAQCFTSLDGAWFAPTATGFASLTLINGWTNAPFSTSNAAAKNAYGIVYFKGAIATSGGIPRPFVLDTRFRPVTNVNIPIDLCNATHGRLLVEASGTVFVDYEGTFSDIQCFTSLDGASFVQ